uniref:Uncharacterized protein n=1 Tax=Populus trichocarpa TaxID=3694 RepID=A0A3N7G796_POPTR
MQQMVQTREYLGMSFSSLLSWAEKKDENSQLICIV